MPKRQRDGTEALVYAYGLLDDQAELYVDPNVTAEVQRQRELWDLLVRLEHEHEERIYQYLDEHCEEYRQSFEALCVKARELWRLLERKRRARATARQKIDTPELDAAIAAARKAWTHAQKEMRACRSHARRAHKEALAALRKEHYERIPKCKESPLYWGNYNRIRQSFDATLKRVRRQGRTVRFSDPHRDDVCLTVQIQRVGDDLGASFADLLAGRFSALKIEPVDPAAWTTTRANRRRLGRTIVTMRVDRAGNTVRVMVALDRPVPPEARIKSAQLVWRRVGERQVGKLCLTISMPAIERTNDSTAACGIDLGWRRTDDGGLRVATIVDSAGRVDRLALPPDWMSGMDQVARLSQYLDESTLDAATLLLGREDLPPDVASALKGWRPGLGAGHVNVKALRDAVRAHGFYGLPVDLCCGVRDWRKRKYRCCWYHQHIHLATWRDNLRRKLLLRRREIYRLAAASLAEQYRMIAIEDLDLAKMALTKRREDGCDPRLHAAARAQRQRACLHELRSELKHQARKRGAKLELVDASKTTIVCHECGAESQQTSRDRMMIHMACASCGAVWDQDVNAARNILLAAIGASGEVVPQDDDGGSRTYNRRSEGISDRSQFGAPSL